MQRRVCWQAKSSWSGEISMTQAKRLKESRCFTTIQRSLPAHWTKPRWHIGKQATPRKRIAYRASCASDIRITPMDNSSLLRLADYGGPWSKRLFYGGYNCMPQGPSPTLIRFNSLRDLRSTTE